MNVSLGTVLDGLRHVIPGSRYGLDLSSGRHKARLASSARDTGICEFPSGCPPLSAFIASLRRIACGARICIGTLPPSPPKAWRAVRALLVTPPWAHGRTSPSPVMVALTLPMTFVTVQCNKAPASAPAGRPISLRSAEHYGAPTSAAVGLHIFFGISGLYRSDANRYGQSACLEVARKLP